VGGLQHTVPEPEVEGADAGERDSTGVAVAALLTKPATWAIIAANFVNHWGYFIYLNWMPIYFNKVLKFNVRTSALYSFLPWLVMVCFLAFLSLC
jgi:ACS family sodium-dependent inorganic phosphate cotransporter/ACS family sodium-dependent inorganic phosphate cotransporter-like MFS transporter 9